MDTLVRVTRGDSARAVSAVADSARAESAGNMILTIERGCRTGIAAWQDASAAHSDLPRGARRERILSAEHAGTVSPARAVDSTEPGAALTVARRPRGHVGWPRIAAASVAVHRLPPADSRAGMAGRRAFAGMAAAQA